MTCPRCTSKTIVTETACGSDDKGPFVVRYRQCKGCGHQFATVESVNNRVMITMDRETKDHASKTYRRGLRD